MYGGGKYYVFLWFIYILRYVMKVKCFLYGMYIFNILVKGWFYLFLEKLGYNFEIVLFFLGFCKVEKYGCKNLINILKLKV